MTTCVPWDLDSGCCTEWEDLDPDVADRAEVLAWSTISLLTAGRVGRCAVTMRPCLVDPCNWCSTWWPTRPMIVNGEWINRVCGLPECSCVRLCEIVLDHTVAQITGGTADGIALDPSLFRVDNGTRIVRTDGECFPSCQLMDRPLSEVGTFSLTYVPGIVPDAAGLWAAGVLACEYARACSGAKCRLPATLSTIARQGVTMQLSVGLFPDGITGIREVDAYIGSVNPNHLRIAPRVWSPDIAAAKHRYATWNAPTP